MDSHEYDEIIRTLVQIAAHQDTINADVRESIQHQGMVNARLAAAIERLDATLAHVEITQARVETLLSRMLRHEENGRKA